MMIKMFMTRIKATLLQAVLVMSLALGFAAPAQAGPFSDWLNCITRGICGGGGSGGGGGGGGGGSGGGNTPEPVDPTGIVHPVYLVGGAFFPDEVHAQPGDEIKFYNLANTTHTVRADDWSWESDALSKDQSWSLIVQEDTELLFRRSSYNSSYYGEIILGDKPEAVDFGDLIDENGNVIGKDEEVVRQAEGLGYTLAEVGGLIQDVGSGLSSLLSGISGDGTSDGNGSALGLTQGFGVGNNY
ncbi:cupredoxin domain-containing protein [Pseudooceanicola nitratireducens]|uniref:cupredoxin domain-containing protein n=1 Tax=Pseudooceanicola nitratireducens TaxID=517719 RepID=UPI001C94A828|nr:hypothetical protein [Pseudooceanicola nitratireducens]MBY6158518.1 hypothetical protein [Pseudooceanicola nitratireducens]